MTRTNTHGDVELHWAVSYNAHYGPPRQLAYKLDTIVINQLLDALPRPLPRVLKLGSLRQLCTLLDLEGSGRQQAELKRAFHQNPARISSPTCAISRDGTTRTVNTGFTRYSVIFTGESLPDGTKADAVYLMLSDPYLDVLNHAPVRPLDYAYLKALTPMAQRFYELLSYKIYAALKYRHPRATLRYADYCLLSTQQRYIVLERVQKQMYKVHRPHIQSGYLTQVQYEATTDADGQPDWRLHYTPAPKRVPVYHVSARPAWRRRCPGEDAEPPISGPHDAGDSRARPPPPRRIPRRKAHAAVYQGHATGAPGDAHGQRTDQATTLLTTHGREKARHLLTFSHQGGPGHPHHPRSLWGHSSTTPAGWRHMTHGRPGTHVTTQTEAAANAPAQRTARGQQQLAGLRAALPPPGRGAGGRSCPPGRGHAGVALRMGGRRSTGRWRRRLGCRPLRPGSRHRGRPTAQDTTRSW
jgi:hypothetical protein